MEHNFLFLIAGVVVTYLIMRWCINIRHAEQEKLIDDYLVKIGRLAVDKNLLQEALAELKLESILNTVNMN